MKQRVKHSVHFNSMALDQYLIYFDSVNRYVFGEEKEKMNFALS